MCIGEGIHQKELKVIILSLAVGQKKKKKLNIYLLIVEQHQKQTPELFVYVCKKVIGGDFKVILLATSSLSLL